MDGVNVSQSIFTSLISLFVGGGGVAWFNSWQSRKARISGDEREARRDTVSDRDGLIDRLMKRLDTLEDQRDEDEVDIAALHRHIETLVEHIGVLESHIYGGKQPPPPPRPVII